MALARRFHPQPLLQRLRHPKKPQDKSLEGKIDLLIEIDEGYDQEFDWAYRNFQWGPTEPPHGGGGGGTVRDLPRRLVPVCSLVEEVDQITPPMWEVAFPIWNRGPVRHLEGVAQDAEISRITGTVYVEPYSGGVPTVYLVDCLAQTQPLYVPAGSLVGFDVGFGRFGTERLKFRIDVIVYEAEATAELTAMVPDKIEKFQSTEDILSESLLTDYNDAGLRFKCNLTLAG